MLQAPPVWRRAPESDFQVVVIGASAGGLTALRTILTALPAAFPGAIVIAHHRGAGSTDHYRALLQRGTALRVAEAINGERPVGSGVYVAPEGRQLQLRDGKFYTANSLRYETVRPSADLLFRSAAAMYGARTVAVVLSGYGRDGAAGVCAIRARGGFVIAQDESSSERFDMPCSAIETRRVDVVLPLRHIAFALTTLFSASDWNDDSRVPLS